MRKFYHIIEPYVEEKSNPEIYKFFIEKVLLLGSLYSVNKDDKINFSKFEIKTSNFLESALKLKKQLYKDLTDCLKLKKEFFPEDDESDILTSFINTYDLFEKPITEEVSRFYKFKEIAKIVILLNLSFFNIFPIENLTEFEKLRQLNKPLFLTFLWYLKDLYWGDYSSPLKLKKDIKAYFTDENEYNYLNDLLELYPYRVVVAKEYFYTHHNIILKENVDNYLAEHDQKQKKMEKAEARYSADFYILNQEFQRYEKTKEKIYSKFRKENKSKAEIQEAIDNAYKIHLRNQIYLGKRLFKSKIEKNINEDSKSIVPKRNSIGFFIDRAKTEIQYKTYDELIMESTELLKKTLEALKVYEEYSSLYKEGEVNKYQEPDIHKKVLKKKLIEPNIWNRFRDYCFVAIDKYPKKIKPLSDLNDYLQAFIIDFMGDSLNLWEKPDFNLKARLLELEAKKK